MKNKSIRVMVEKLHDSGLSSWHESTVDETKDYYKHLEADLFDVIYVDFKGHKLSVFIDDEGMLKAGNLGRGVVNYPQPIFGNIVVTGSVDDKGNTLGVPEELTIVDFVDFSGKILWVMS